MVLEPAAAGFAALRANSSHIKKLTGALSNFEESLAEGNLVEMIRSDIHFHALIGVATGNKTIQLLMGTITKYLFDGWKATLRVKGRPQKTVLEHGKILEAVVERNEGKAKQAMQRHLRNAVQDLKTHGLG